MSISAFFFMYDVCFFIHIVEGEYYRGHTLLIIYVVVWGSLGVCRKFPC